MTCPKSRDGTHWPPCAIKRDVPSTTVWLPSSSNTATTGATTDSTRANCCFSNLLRSMRPSASKVRMENVLRTTRTGFLPTSSTTTLAIRARCPAKAGRQWLAGSCSIRSNLALGSRQRVSSQAIRNIRQENPTALPLASMVTGARRDSTIYLHSRNFVPIPSGARMNEIGATDNLDKTMCC
jgi:hypothetical protein